MDDVSLAEAKAGLSRLVTRAAQGETVRITRRGKIVAQITPAASPLARIDVASLRAVTEFMASPPAADRHFVRQMRDQDRY